MSVLASAGVSTPLFHQTLPDHLQVLFTDMFSFISKIVVTVRDEENIRVGV